MSQPPTTEKIVASFPAGATVRKIIVTEASFGSVDVTYHAPEDGVRDHRLEITFPVFVAVERFTPKSNEAVKAIMSVLAAAGVPSPKEDWFFQECYTILEKPSVVTGTYGEVLVSFSPTDDERIRIACD